MTTDTDTYRLGEVLDAYPELSATTVHRYIDIVRPSDVDPPGTGKWAAYTALEARIICTLHLASLALRRPPENTVDARGSRHSGGVGLHRDTAHWFATRFLAGDTSATYEDGALALAVELVDDRLTTPPQPVDNRPRKRRREQ